MSLDLSCDIVVLGGGDHGRVVVEAIRLSHPHWRVVVLDPDPNALGREIFGAQVVGGDDLFNELVPPGPRVPFAVGIGGIKDMSLRKMVYEFAISSGGLPMKVVHPRSIISPLSTLGTSVQVLAAAVINPGADIGENTIINTAAVIEHDCIIGSHTHVATNATLSGGVEIGDLAFIGAGAVVRQGLKVGDRSLVGAGAVVVRDVPPGDVVVGSPARSIKV